VTTPQDPVDELRRWELSGGVWRVLARSADTLTVGLYTCDGGEEMGRLTSTDQGLLTLVGERKSSED